jgi:proteasome lid subunit RPN8/RPN11
MFLPASDYEKTERIYLKNDVYEEIKNHCLRKLSGHYLKNETQETQAYGLLGARIENNTIHIEKIFPCRQNFRNDTSVVHHINSLVDRYALSADTPIHQRGWVIQPEELLEAYDEVEALGLEVIGSYHMHHDGSWLTDMPKEYPSQFDAKLAENSEMLMFIVSIKSGSLYSIRAFYNGLQNKEIRIIINDVE